MNLKGQVQQQVAYSKTHVGKTLGIGAGIATGVVYGMAGKKEGWVISGLALGGAVAGAILGGMFDNAKNSKMAFSGAAGFADDLYIGGTEGLAKRATGFAKSGGVQYSNVGGKTYKVVCGEETNQAGQTFTTTGDIILLEHNGDVKGWEEWACGRIIIGDVGAAKPMGGNLNQTLGAITEQGKTGVPANAPKVDNKIGRTGLSAMKTLVRPVNVSNKVGSVARQKMSNAIGSVQAGDPCRGLDEDAREACCAHHKEGGLTPPSCMQTAVANQNVSLVSNKFTRRKMSNFAAKSRPAKTGGNRVAGGKCHCCDSYGNCATIDCMNNGGCPTMADMAVLLAGGSINNP